MKVARIAVNYPLKNSGLLYFYDSDLFRGDIVKIPLGKRTALGCVLSPDESSSNEFKKTPAEKIKSVINVLKNIRLTEGELKLYEWMAQYYHYSLGQLIFDCLPHQLKRPRGLEFTQGLGENLEYSPNNDQQKTIESLKKNLHYFNRSLIHGVTGSGKTTIYIEIMKEVILSGKSVLFLLPEINLTPQFITFFAQYLNAPIYSYHSDLSDSQKYQLWTAAGSFEKGALILGVRSAVFLPIVNLGLIIIDEEHDNSFKQDDRCSYNARDVASKKAQLLNIPLIMGSATPSVETYYHFHQGTQNLFELKNRAGESYLPKITLLDSRKKIEDDQKWPLINESIDAISEALSRNEQVIVFVNRLGYASYLQCRSCGEQFHCPNCSIGLRFYKNKNQLSCHHCEYKEPFVPQCRSCGCITISNKGFGTEKIQEVLKGIFPNKTIERFDREDIKNFNQLEKRLGDFHAGKIDVLVGTQMLSKGHNFEKVKLVIILGIDSQLNFPDFRSVERVYQTLTQVSGRAGRYSKDGKVVLQTLNPDHPLFKIVESHEFHQFYEDEIVIRKLCDSPPFKRLAIIHFSSRFQDRLVSHLNDHVSRLIRDLISQNFPQVVLLGPRPSFIEKRANQFTWSVLLKSNELSQLHNLLKSFEMNYEPKSSISYKIDVDPYNLI